ncbi:ABC transporter permease [Vicingus serpentipes]|uniref:Transport permease protein n=1 Tax=Vicingus serpentipes TaxID=1926625 RepID=A0A5C6RV55_9FLAO|nr:ABC transporter permease [Vicingus serpentipes]TXB65420.1 ABC transporter permease [Vicingus serpentipes]
MTDNTNIDWKFEISPKGNLLELNFKEIWKYRDLLVLFVKRDIITIYKQTILGPLWYLIQPIFTSVIFTIIFNNVANIDTNGIPPFLFNLAGITTWNYFRDCLIATSDTFKSNQHIFGKVYFPRIILPLSIVVSNLIKFSIQILVFIMSYLYYTLYKGVDISPNDLIILYPFLVVIMGILSLGLGMIISSMVTKYRDLMFLLQFGVQLLMYLSLVAYPLSLIQQKLPQLSWIVEYNPMAHIIEASRYLLLNSGDFSLKWMLYTISVTIVVFLLGVLIFNKTEKRFIDTV